MGAAFMSVVNSNTLLVSERIYHYFENKVNSVSFQNKLRFLKQSYSV